MNKLQKTDSYLARLLMMCLFMPERLQVLVVVGVSVYFAVRSIAGKQFAPRQNYLWAALLGSGYLLYLLAVPIEPAEYRHFALTMCERRLSLLLLPVACAIIAPTYRSLMVGELVFFVYACFISCGLANVDYLYHYLIKDGGLPQLSHVDYRNIFEFFTGIHPTYMGMYLCFSICILLLSPPPQNRIQMVVRNGLIYILLIFLLTLLAKSPLIALVFIGIHYLYVHRRSLYKYKMAFAGVGALLAGVYFFIPFFRQRLGEMFHHEQGNILNNSVQVRKLIWDVDTTLVRRYWLTGVGPGRMLQMLNERYFFYSLHNGFWVGYFDPHNQYFAEWLSFGILGILVFLAMLGAHFYKAIRMRDHLHLYLMIICCVTFFTETLLSRQQGVLFFAVFTSLLFFHRRDTREVL